MAAIVTLLLALAAPALAVSAPVQTYDGTTASPPPSDTSADAATAQDAVNRQARSNFDDYVARRAMADRDRIDYERGMAEHRKTLEEAATERQRYDAARAAADAKLAAWTAEYGPDALAAKNRARRKPAGAAAAPPVATTPICQSVRSTGSSIPQRVCTARPVRSAAK